MPEIITRFKFEQEGQQDILATLVQTGKVEQETATAVNNTNKAFAEQSKQIQEENKNLKALSDTMKSLPKNVVGGYAKQFTDMAAAIKAGDLQVDLLNTSIALTKKRLQELTPGTKAYTDLQNELKASLVVNENLNKSFTSSRSELRAMRETILQLEDAGLSGTKAFQTLAIEAGKLDDAAGDAQARIKALASDTFALDATISTVQGVAGAFALASGAAALFGDENEEVQRALLKVNAAMSILQGLQQVQNLLQAQSSAVIATQLALQRISVLQTNLQAAAESRFTIIRVAATAAQATLNAVMAANQATVLLVAIGALAAGLLYLTSRTDEEAEAQAELARQLELTNQGLRNQVNIVASLADADDRQLQILRARGVEGSKLARAEIQNTQTQIERNERLIESLKGRQGVEDEYDEALQNRVRLRAQLAAEEAGLPRIIAEEGKKARQAEKEETQLFLQDQVAANEIAVDEARTSLQRFEAEVQAIQSRLRLTLANTDLGQNERVLAEVKAGQEIRSARQTYLGELTEIETNFSNEYAKGLNDQVLANSKANQEKLASDRAANEQRLQFIYEEGEARRRQVVQALQFANQLAGMLRQLAQETAQDQISALDKQLEQQLITQEQYDLEVRKIKRKQAQEDKELALFQAVVNGAAAVVEALPNVFLAALAGALAAAQIAFIASRPIPAFKKGTKNAPGGPSLIAEAGPELWYTNGRLQYVDRPQIVDMAKGDRVIPAPDTARIMSAWNVPVPNVGQQAGVMQMPTSERIDYEKLARLIGREVGKIPFEVNNWDEKGYNKHQQIIKNREQYRKTKYSFGRH